ncbi:hypothetical protein [Rhodopseudomonas sp. BR0G17]|uniref:hypothetical protein n=1 Tax=Rhodopseudomonas sp. BR0G17 TaxID=2269368 RepID=UPI0013DEC1AF|nr:hypothetical protein [Rhodopseudomonas sp. BR0G17]NEW96641.1 hypothetical protein [Rhodopseudomonas sp. BR0G17]
MLAQTFLRIAALEALRPSSLLAAGGPWPTLAGDRVSDSRLDPFDHLAPESGSWPVLAVYTEDDDLTKIAQHGPQFYKAAVDLVFELAVVQRFQGAPGEGLIVDYADTDSASEARLDVMRQQIFHCLHEAPSGRLFRRLAKLPFDSWQSHAKRSGEEAIKIAGRTIVGRIAVRETCIDAAPASALVDLDRLPAPLKEVAQELSDTSTYYAELTLGIARAAPVMPVRKPLSSVSMNIKPAVQPDGEQPIDASADGLQT